MNELNELNEFEYLMSHVFHKIARTGKEIKLISITSDYYERVLEAGKELEITSPSGKILYCDINDEQEEDFIIIV